MLKLDGSPFKIALIGRPNVGKSTLFNRLIQRRVALTHDTAGLTRDRRYGMVTYADMSFELIDTPGLFDATTQEYNRDLARLMADQTRKAIQEADLVFFMLDVREGLLPHDESLAHELRRASKRVWILLNKAEKPKEILGCEIEASCLGLAEYIIPVSAEHGVGIQDLMMLLEDSFPERLIQKQEEEEEENIDEKPLQLLILGRPNVGKSTLVNTLLKEDRLLTMDMPGVTRDAIQIEWCYEGRRITLVDTAGIRRQSRVSSQEERLCVFDAKRTLNYAASVILLIDASLPFDYKMEKQDLTLASLVIEEGRSLVIGLNKWDQVKDGKAYLAKLKVYIETHLYQAHGVPIIPLSALKGEGLEKLMKAVVQQDLRWNKRIPTHALNTWLKEVTEHHQAPRHQGIRLRFKYMTQIKSRPPTFVLFANRPSDLETSYERYLIKALRETFDFKGVPIRFQVRGSKNPYKPKDTRVAQKDRVILKDKGVKKYKGTKRDEGGAKPSFSRSR